MREVEYMIAPEEIMDGVEMVLTEGRLVLGTDGVDRVLIMGAIEALFMIGTMVLHMTGPGVLIMEDTEGSCIFWIAVLANIPTSCEFLFMFVLNV